MSGWLAKARTARSQTTLACSGACANCANCAKTSREEAPAGGFGTNGTIGTASEVPVEEIRSRFRWALGRLQEEHGRAPERARKDALAIVRADLLNDPRLASVQPNPRVCFVCDGPGTSGRVLVPVLSGQSEQLIWVHLEPCHGEHRARCRRHVDQLLRTALGPSPSARTD